MEKTKMLKKNYEFRKVLTKGSCFYGENVIAYIHKNKIQNYNFLGIAISTKIGKAVRRNHLKRLIRESYYFYEQQITTGNDIVFLWNKKTGKENVQFEDIKKDLKKIFQQAKIFLEGEK